MTPEDIKQSDKLEHVLYDIRGPVLEEAKRLEEQGHRITKLNIGNPAPFGFEAPPEILVDVIRNLQESQGYSDSQGIRSARTAVVQHYQTKGIDITDPDDIWLGNGVSELIQLSLNALLNGGDEVLIPAPDYPLWTASTSLAGGTPVHYLCDEDNEWNPNLDDIRSKITKRLAPLLLSTRTTQRVLCTARRSCVKLLTLRLSTTSLFSPTKSTTRSCTETLCITRLLPLHLIVLCLRSTDYRRRTVWLASVLAG